MVKGHAATGHESRDDPGCRPPTLATTKTDRSCLDGRHMHDTVRCRPFLGGWRSGLGPHLKVVAGQLPAWAVDGALLDQTRGAGGQRPTEAWTGRSARLRRREPDACDVTATSRRANTWTPVPPTRCGPFAARTHHYAEAPAHIKRRRAGHPTLPCPEPLLVAAAPPVRRNVEPCCCARWRLRVLVQASSCRGRDRLRRHFTKAQVSRELSACSRLKRI